MSSDQSIYCLAWLMVDIPMVLWKTSDNKYSVHLIHTKSLSLFSFSKLEIKADRSIELTDDHTCKNRLSENELKQLVSGIHIFTHNVTELDREDWKGSSSEHSHWPAHVAKPWILSGSVFSFLDYS